jgi:hypothetical protein
MNSTGLTYVDFSKNLLHFYWKNIHSIRIIYFVYIRVLHDELPHTLTLRYEYLLSREDDLLSILTGSATFSTDS